MRKPPISPSILPKDDIRYIKWRKSLKKRHNFWNKGLTKETHPSIAKISETYKRKKIDNFAKWRNEMRRLGRIKSVYSEFEKNGELAELIGVVLGDGHIAKFPRTENLGIFSNASNKGFVDRYALLMENIFGKKPVIINHGSNCKKISIYEKFISKRLGIPTGARKNLILEIPFWIKNKKEYLIRYLRGLYEAEGSFCVHKKTYTYKLFFDNKNKTLLNNVYFGMKFLGFHPNKSGHKIQISRKEEVYKAIDLLKFRKY